MLSVCRTQASAALSSCETELFAANGLMVVAMYGYRLSKFLSQDDVEGLFSKVKWSSKDCSQTPRQHSLLSSALGQEDSNMSTSNNFTCKVC